MPRHWIPITLLIAGLPVSSQEEKKTVDTPPVEKAIPVIASVSKPPKNDVFKWGTQMAISTNSLVVQDHVLQGLNHLHGGWEAEASRHFTAALQADPENLMAHWGLLMTLITDTPENHDAREATLARMLSMIESGKGTDLERGYAYGIVKYLSEGPEAAANAFRKVANKYPKEMQANVFSSLFGRGGYDDLGFATPDQETSEYHLLKLAATYPDSAIPNHALLTIRAEAPDLEPSIKLAKEVCAMAPDYPPFLHLLGHYQWRSGRFDDAVASFSKASELYSRWMQENEVPLAYCPEKIRTESYRIVALASSGKTEEALAQAEKLATLTIPKEQLQSPGNRMLWWEAKTLPARIGHMIGTKESLEKALASLPPPEEVKQTMEFTQACWWIDGMRFILTGLIQVADGKIDDARNTANATTSFGELMVRAQNKARSQGELTHWLRGFRSLEVLTNQLRGEIAMASPPGRRGPAYNWFASARDHQSNQPVLLPPLILFPMSSRLGDFQMLEGRFNDAADAYEQALQKFPAHRHSLEALARARQEAGKKQQ